MGFFKNFVKALSDPVNLAVAAVSTAVLGPVGGYTALQSFAIRAAAQRGPVVSFAKPIP